MNVGRILANARQFLNAYYVLNANKQHIRDEINKINPYAISPKIFERMRSGELKVTDIPEVVAIAFACEVFLKAMLLHYANIDERTQHHHFKLMNLLPPAIFNDLLQRLRDAMPTMSEELILNCIYDNGRAFVQWRYFHETGQATHMTNFAVIMAETMAAMLDEALGPQAPSEPSDDVL